MVKMFRPVLLGIGFLIALAAVMPVAAGCRVFTSRVYWHGVGGSVYINTPVYACISDAEGKCTSSGGYLYLKNHSSRQSVRWSSTAAGQGEFQSLGPGEELVRYLAIYRRGNESLSADLTVEFCE